MTDLPVLYEDLSLLVVDKPSGLLSVPGRGPEKADCAVSRAAVYYGWIREVHRLDQATSGILLLARNPEAHRFLSAAFASRDIEKSYVALTRSIPGHHSREAVVCETDDTGKSGRITLFQRLDPGNRPHQIVDPVLGKQAITNWRFIGDDGSNSRIKRLELVPTTGRTHQLRLALSSCAAPILGDSLYAPPELRDSAPRLMLHATSLLFPKPDGRGYLDMRSIVPF